MSLARPHAIWWTAGGNPYEVSKAIVQCKMLSGRYRTCKLSSKWSQSGDSSCPSPGCQHIPETLDHLLLQCPAYVHARAGVVRKWKSVACPAIADLVCQALAKPSSYLLQFLLDASVLPEVISLIQSQGEDILNQLFSLTRTWCYSIHRSRINLLKEKQSS